MNRTLTAGTTVFADHQEQELDESERRRPAAAVPLASGRPFLTAAIALVLGFLAMPHSTWAQAKGKSAPKVPATKVDLGQVIDRRSSGSFASLTLNLELPAVKTSDVAAYRVVVMRATDDSGRDLIPENTSDEMQSSPGAMFGREETAPASISFELRNPARSASRLSEVAGEIELYMPSKDPNAVATVTKFMAKPGKPLASPALKTNGVEIVVIGPAELEAEKKKGAEARKKEAQADGIAGEYLEMIVSGFLDGFFSPSPGDVVLKIKDPNKRVQEIVLIDPKGEEQRGSSYERDGMTVLSVWGDPPDEQWGLRVKLKTPKTVAKYSFALKDVALP